MAVWRGNAQHIQAPEEDENERLRTELARHLASQLFPYAEQISRSPWVVHDYSSCFMVEALTAGRREAVFVKIPKADVRRQSIGARSKADRVLASDEYASLVYLSRHWPRKGDVCFVEPRGFYPPYNAIITRRAEGRDLFRAMRRVHALKLCGGSVAVRGLEAALTRLGASLRAFHDASAAAEGLRDEFFDGARALNKIERFVEYNKVDGVSAESMVIALERLAVWRGWGAAAPMAITLKGLDVRNMLIDGRGAVHLFDPGRMKKDCRAADLARLLATFRILYWGNPAFFFRVEPPRSFEQAVLAGYGWNQMAEPQLLKLFLVKELFKHWHHAHAALSLKRWATPLKQSLRNTYINPFYARQVADELCEHA